MIDRFQFLLVVCVLASQAAVADDPTPKQIEFFEAKIRPIFVQHCYKCHSATAEDIEGGLVLDSRWGWEKGGDSGPAVVPGKPDESSLIDAVRYTDEAVSAMPPKSKLPDAQIQLLEQWVEMGAPDPRKIVEVDAPMVEPFDLDKRFKEHWSWRPIKTPTVPSVQLKDWAIDDLDRFILHQLETSKILPAEAASKETWLRRVYFDVIGLPPTPQQIDAFLNDDSENAYETVVKGLLDSPRYGEKWARHWMDLVRYAETYGHEFDYPLPHATEYRNYLIRAFNADVPYNEFIVEHIAGDMLNEPRLNPTEQFNESVIGTGFWYLHEATHAPTDVLTNEADIIDNQLDVFGKTFLGLTVACARCHDHKFDAISTADYYALSAFIQSSCRQSYPLDSGKKIETAVASFRALERQAQKIHDANPNDLLQQAAAYFAAVKQIAKDNPELNITDARIDEIAKQTELDRDRLKRWVEAIKAAKMKDPTPAVALSEHIRGTVDKLRTRLNRDAEKFQNFAKKRTQFANFSGTKLPPGWTTTGAAFRLSDTRTALGISKHPLRTGTIDSGTYGANAVGVLRSPTFKITETEISVLTRSSANLKMNVIIDNYQMAGYNALLFRGTFMKDGATDTKGAWQWKTFAGDLRKYVGHNAYLEFADQGGGEIAIDQIWFSSKGGPPTVHDPLTIKLAQADEPFAKPIPGLTDWLLRNDLVDADAVGSLAKTINDARQVSQSLPKPRYVLAMAEGTRENGHIYVRGSSASLGDSVPPRTLQAFGSREMSRLELAKEIASPNNPLTARVMVNRLWHFLTGRGIVASVDEFGPQGQLPSNPELLDYLASEFIAGDWSVKQMISRIVLSQTYRQRSVANPKNDREHIAVTDPTNRFLYQMRVRRLPGEAIRDAMLQCSGRINLQPIAGSVATHRTAFMTGRGARGSGPLDGDGRRSVYLSVYRNFVNPFMLAFDMPNPFGPKGQRSNSNVPAQALTLMNDPFVIGQAKTWAKKIVASKQDDTARIQEMVRKAHGVRPTESQLERYRKFLEIQKKEYGNNEAQAWADLTHAIFNMKAFYFLK